MSCLLWVRRDLRLHDNPSLSASIKNGAKKAVYISTPQQWRYHHESPIKIDLIKRHLEQYSLQLANQGIELVHLQANDYADQVQTLKHYCVNNHIEQVFANAEPELNEIERDKQVQQQLDIQLELFDCDAIAPKGKILNQQGEMFKSFTPFKRVWLSYVRQFGIDYSLTPDVSTKRGNKLDIPFDYPKADSGHWPLSQTVLEKVLPDFFTNKLELYSRQRDFPAIKGTSGLSAYLNIGAISARWVTAKLIERDPDVLYDSEHPAASWLNELIWRDFYKHLLYHFPELIKGHNFKSGFEHLIWKNDPKDFDAWCNGYTGYPIVDAAMRQLTQTGWMHNRLRMITASFLTKHLLIDWRWGEQFFMSHLIDGDFSANNGGWQWVAGTGCDAQPYFRIFNPITQSKKFDPNGEFIRKYLPELANVPDKHVHFPHEYLEKNEMSHLYWPSIVEHKFARLRALDFYKR